MAKDWVEPNPDHPRDPHSGEFTDKTGAGEVRDWAQKISDEIGSGQHGLSQADREMLLQKIRDTSETVAGHMQQLHRSLDEQMAARSDPLFHQEMSDLTALRPGDPVDTDEGHGVVVKTYQRDGHPMVKVRYLGAEFDWADRDPNDPTDTNDTLDWLLSDVRRV